MRFLLLLTLALSACGPAMRGVPGLNPPPVLRPGHGLPTYDPRHPQAAPERSPDKRVLPPTKEPGLWASGISKDPAVPVLVGVPLPTPEGAERVTGDHPTMACAITMGDAVYRSGGEGQMRTLAQNVRNCLAARLYEHCTTRMVRDRSDLLRRGIQYDDVLFRRFKAAQTSAAAMRKEACHGVESSEADAVFVGAATAWEPAYVLGKGTP